MSSVSENGRELSSFSYDISGQLAEAVTPEKSESFYWDGLALIQRDSTCYVNEPSITGGNPILADGRVLFNDMLGTTLGIKDGDKVTQNNLTAFGESLSASTMEDSFFTGKPHVGEMGYVFLFRAYRADQGKWQTSDPLGYPDGWNNFAYVNNGVTIAIDWMGGKIVVKGSTNFQSFANAVINIAQGSNTTAGQNIKTLVDHPGGGFMDRNSTVVREYTSDQEFGYWPGTTADNLGGSGANVSSGLYTYAFENGTQRDPAFALLHELLHAYDINVNGHIPLPGGNPEREREINQQVSELMNDPAVKASFKDILNRYPPQGIIRKGQGLVE